MVTSPRSVTLRHVRKHGYMHFSALGRLLAHVRSHPELLHASPLHWPAALGPGITAKRACLPVSEILIADSQALLFSLCSRWLPAQRLSFALKLRINHEGRRAFHNTHHLYYILINTICLLPSATNLLFASLSHRRHSPFTLASTGPRLRLFPQHSQLIQRIHSFLCITHLFLIISSLIFQFSLLCRPPSLLPFLPPRFKRFTSPLSPRRGPLPPFDTILIVPSVFLHLLLLLSLLSIFLLSYPSRSPSPCPLFHPSLSPLPPG